MGKNVKDDAVDLILMAWNRERPDLDVSPMAAIGRLRRCELHLRQKLDAVFSRYGLSGWEFDVLATLRRSGAPYRLAPTDLFSALMVSSGTMTHRLKGLEARGLVVRVLNEADARSLLVELSDAGLQLIDEAVAAHVENERQMLEGLGAADLRLLDQGLKRLLAVLEG